MPDVSLLTLVVLVVVAFAAGWIDAVVGGGGLLQLPAMLLGLPNASPAQILSTNKISSLCGTTTSAVTFGVKVRPDRKTVVPLAILAGLGSAAGALVATRIPMSWFKPIVLVLLIGVAIYTAFKPSLGARTALRFDGRDHYVAASVVGVLIGFYDGAVGPGTGSFLISRWSASSVTTSSRPARRRRSPTSPRIWARSSSSRCTARRCGASA